MPAAYTRSMTDYPDWQTFPNAQTGNLFNPFSATLPPGTYDSGLIPALSWSSIMIICGASAGGATITITHYGNAAATQIIDSDTWPINATTRLVVRSPLRGTFINLNITVTSAVNLVGEFWANFLSASSERISFPVSQQNLSDFNRTLAAGATATYNIGEIVGGQAYFYIKPYDAAGALNPFIICVDENGNPGQLVTNFGNPTAILRESLAIPDKIVQVNITNTGAAAHTYDFSLTVPPQ